MGKTLNAIVGALLVTGVVLGSYACSSGKGESITGTRANPSQCQYKHTSNTSNPCYKVD